MAGRAVGDGDDPVADRAEGADGLVVAAAGGVRRGCRRRVSRAMWSTWAQPPSSVLLAHR